MGAWLGMRGSGNFSSDERPKNYTEGIMMLHVNGTIPITGIITKLGRTKTDDPEFKWHEKLDPVRSVAITGIYTDVALSSAYVSGGVAGSILQIKMVLADVKNFLVGNQVVFQDVSDPTNEHVGKVTAAVQNGASSYVTVRLLEADNNGTGTDISNADYLTIMGNVNPEGGEMPDSVAYDPSVLSNYTQIQRHALSITRTARKTRLRTKDAYNEAKRECMLMHAEDKERSVIWGIPTEGTGSNGKPERTTGGLLHFMRTYSGLITHYPTATGYTGKAWLQGGEDWIDESLETTFKYGNNERFAPCGPTALRHIGRLVKSLGQFQFTPTTKSYGIEVVEWHTAFGTIYLKLHPMFSTLVPTRQWILLLSMKDVKEKYIDETHFIPSKVSDSNHKDSSDDEFLYEGGWMPTLSRCNSLLTGVGSDA